MFCFSTHQLPSFYHLGFVEYHTPFGGTPENSVKLQSDHTRWTPFIHNTHLHGYRYQQGGHCCAPLQCADRFCGPDPIGTCCRRVSRPRLERGSRLVFPGSPSLPGTGTDTFTPAVAQAPTIPAAAPESPATTTSISDETMLPGETHEWQDNVGEDPVTEHPKKGKRTYGRLELKPPDLKLREFGGGPHRKSHPLEFNLKAINQTQSKSQRWKGPLRH